MTKKDRTTIAAAACSKGNSKVQTGILRIKASLEDLSKKVLKRPESSLKVTMRACNLKLGAIMDNLELYKVAESVILMTGQVNESEYSEGFTGIEELLNLIPACRKTTNPLTGDEDSEELIDELTNITEDLQDILTQMKLVIEDYKKETATA